LAGDATGSARQQSRQLSSAGLFGCDLADDVLRRCLEVTRDLHREHPRRPDAYDARVRPPLRGDPVATPQIRHR